MLIKTKYIDCASKRVFNTWKLPTSAADTSGDIYWSAIVYIKDTGEVWTHGKLYGGFFSNADNNKVSLTIGGTTKILALDGHVQSYTTLTGSGSTANQAILSTGVANKWTLKTLGKNAFSNVDYLPADATAVAAEKVVHALAFQYNGKAIHSFDGSVARVLNIIQGNNVFITGDSQGNVTIAADPGSDTVNTAGATNLINKKLFLIGAESQTTSPQTYSNQYVYIGTDNCLYSLGKKVLTEHQAIYNLDLQTQVGKAVTKVTTFDPNAANNSFTLVQGTNVTLTPDAANKKVTISSKNTTYDFYNLVFKQGESIIDTYKPTTSPSKTLKAGTNVTFTGSNNEVLITTKDTRNTAGASDKLATKLFLTGSLTQTDNPQTYTNSKVYIGVDNKLYSDGKVVSTGDHTHNYAGATNPGGPALKVDLNPSGLLNAIYGSYGGILQDSNKGPVSGSWSNRIKILHNNSAGYYTELAQNFTGTAGLWHRRNVAGRVSEWTPVIDKANFRTYLDSTYVIRGNDPNVLTNYVRYSIASGLTMNWEWGNATPTHIWGAKASDSSKAYVFNGDNIRAFANAVNRAGDTMTGTLKVTEIQATNGKGLVMWNGTTYTYLGMQAGTTYIRSGATDLQHRYNGTDYKIWDARNLVGLRTEHSHNTINHIDSRDAASTPQEHAAGVWLDFKANAKAGLSDGGSYAGLLTVRKYGDTTDWTGGKSAQLGFTDNSNVWVRFGSGASWENWKQLATTGWADGKFLPLTGGTVTGNIILKGSTNTDMTNANIHPRLRFDNSDSSQTVSFIFTDYDSYRAPAGIKLVGNQGNEWFEAPKLIKTGSSDNYVLLGGGGHKALAQFVYAAGNLGVQESTGTSDNIGRAQFWRDKSLSAYGVTLCHSDNAGYKTKIYHDYGSGGNLYMKACANGTWGSVYTIWNSGNFDPDTKVNKAGDTMTGTLGMGANTIYWKENGFGDKFGLTPYFSGTDNSNYLAFMSSVGAAGTDPTMTAKMVLTGLGNVGIGTTTPTQKLHVIGGGLFTALLTTTGITNNGTLTQNGDIIIEQASTTGTRQVRFQGGDNDYGRVAYGGTASNAGWMEIASCDDGNEPIYARQYTGVFTTVKRTATLLDANGNTVFPGTVTAPTFTGALNGTAEWSKRLATNSQLTFGLNGLTYFNANLGAGIAANQNVGPTAQWWHILRMNRGNGSGYFADIAVPLNTSDGIYWRRIQGGTNYGWYRVLDTNNYARIIDGRYVNVTGDTMTGKLSWSMNGVTSSISNDNGSYTHHSTTASAGHWFNKNVYVSGNVYGGSSYNRILAFKDEINSQVGGSKSAQMSWASWGTGTYDGAIQIRETSLVGNSQSAWGYSPALTFHWSNRYAKRFGMRSDGQFAVDDTPISLSTHNHNSLYVTALGTNGNYLTWTKNGTANNLTVPYATNSGSSSTTNKLNITGYQSNGLSFYQTSSSFDGSPADWAHYIIANHGNGSSYYHYTIRLPFQSVPQYKRQTGNTSSVSSWYKFWTEENLNPVDKTLLKKTRIPGEIIDFYVYQVNGYTCTSYNYSTFKSQLFESNGRGKTSVTYRPSSYSSTTYTVNLSDFVLCTSGWASGFYGGMYTAAAGATEDYENRVGASAGSNSKSITGYQMPRHTHWFAHHRGDNANDRDHFGPEPNNGDSPNGIQSAGQGGNWHTGYSGRGDAIDFRPRTFMVFKIMYMPQSY